MQTKTLYCVRIKPALSSVETPVWFHTPDARSEFTQNLADATISRAFEVEVPSNAQYAEIHQMVMGADAANDGAPADNNVAPQRTPYTWRRIGVTLGITLLMIATVITMSPFIVAGFIATLVAGGWKAGAEMYAWWCENAWSMIDELAADDVADQE